jgi:hypothetical protein
MSTYRSERLIYSSTSSQELLGKRSGWTECRPSAGCSEVIMKINIAPTESRTVLEEIDLHQQKHIAPPALIGARKSWLAWKPQAF